MAALEQKLTQNTSTELLAPAGGVEQLAAAIRYGANAVYLATNKFGMRARAANFAIEDLPNVVRAAHSHGVRVYVTCNILMGAKDIAELPQYFEALASAGVDAAIIGDLGAARLATKYATQVALHVSTQASVANAEAARAWYELGAKRIVCAREMSLEEIAQMREDTPKDLEIEAFVHGAQCMAVSGRCLISAYLTGRSANKGHCTQPCRWSYALEEEKRSGEYFPAEEDAHGTYILNAKDLNMLEYVRELEHAGINSLKIEGRNKKAFYVATVVNAYRRVLDGADPALVEDELYTVSHRPYSTGFYFGEAVQSSDLGGYDQSCVHMADVLACKPANELNKWIVDVKLRNKFVEGEELEVLAPNMDSFCITVRELEWLPSLGDEKLSTDQLLSLSDALIDSSKMDAVAVTEAGRSAAYYRFAVYANEIKGKPELQDNALTPMSAGSFLRKRKILD